MNGDCVQNHNKINSQGFNKLRNIFPDICRENINLQAGFHLNFRLTVLRWVHTCNVTAYRTAVTLQVTGTRQSYDLNFHPVPHGVTVSCERYTVGFPVCYGSQKHHECKEGERSGRYWRVTLHVQTCSGRNRIIPLMRRPNTDNARNMPVTLPRNQLLIRNVVTSPVHTVTIQC
jgi:hypothetical protein